MLSETRGFSREAGSRTQKNQLFLSLQKAVRRSPTRYPLQIRCPKDLVIQWQSSIKSDTNRLDNSGGPARRGLARFWVLFSREKSTPSETSSAEGCCPLIQRRSAEKELLLLEGLGFDIDLISRQPGSETGVLAPSHRARALREPFL